MFVGASRSTARRCAAAHKFHNDPERYARDRRALPRARDHHPLLEHPRVPAGHRAGHPRAPRDAARARARRRVVLHPHARFPGTEQYDDFRRDGLDHRDEPRPLRRNVRDVAAPEPLGRRAATAALPLLPRVLPGAGRRAESSGGSSAGRRDYPPLAARSSRSSVSPRCPGWRPPAVCTRWPEGSRACGGTAPPTTPRCGAASSVSTSRRFPASLALSRADEEINRRAKLVGVNAESLRFSPQSLTLT